MTAALEAARFQQQFGRAHVPEDPWLDTVLQAWGLMGRSLDYAALPVVVEMLDVDDPARLVDSLALLRDGLTEA